MSDLESHELVLLVDEGATRGWIIWGDTTFKMGLSNWRGGFSIEKHPHTVYSNDPHLSRKIAKTNVAVLYIMFL